MVSGVNVKKFPQEQTLLTDTGFQFWVLSPFPPHSDFQSQILKNEPWGPGEHLMVHLAPAAPSKGQLPLENKEPYFSVSRAVLIIFTSQ